MTATTIKFLLLFFLVFVLVRCAPKILTGPLTALTVNVASIGSTTATRLTYNAPIGSAYSSVFIDEGAEFLPRSICSSAVIFGLQGVSSCSLYTPLASQIFRNVNSAQLTQIQEVATYNGSGSNPTLPSNYREIPDANLDDDGNYNSDAGCSPPCTPQISITWPQHVGLNNCGTSQPTLAQRVANCLSINPSLALWSGPNNGSGGQSTWNLVTRNTPAGTCDPATVNSCRLVEVWRDNRTGLLWSSVVAGSNASTGAAASSDNWCKAAGSAQAVANGWPTDDPGGKCGDPANQNQTTPQSYCLEKTIYGPALTPAIAGENWTTGVYDNAKGGMGVIASTAQPSVHWRLPTGNDYKQAYVDGIVRVMPEMGPLVGGGFVLEWSATIISMSRDRAMAFLFQYAPAATSETRDSAFMIRCIGR